MSGGIAVASVNPLAGNDANSVENAAMGFTEDLQRENEPRRPSSARSRPSGQDEGDHLFPDTEDPDTDPNDDGHAEEDDPLRDDLLEDDTPPKKEGEDDEEENNEEDEENPDEDEDEGEDEDEDDIDALMEREFEVTVNGETESLPLKEILAGYSRDADYRQKTEALAREREELVEYAQEVVAERKQYADTLQSWIDMTAALEPSQADWDALEKADPKSFIELQKQWAAIRGKVEEAKTEQQKIAEREAEDATREYNRWVQTQNAELLKRVPALANKDKAKEFRSRLFTGGKQIGYSEEEIQRGAVDARDVMTLYYASRWLELQASRKNGQRPANSRKGPKTSATTQPRQVASPKAKAANTRNRRDADRRLQRSGSVDDAAMAFTEMLRNDR